MYELPESALGRYLSILVANAWVAGKGRQAEVGKLLQRMFELIHISLPIARVAHVMN